MLDNKSLEIIQSIIKTRSISKAADNLYLSQPSVSRYLKKIETELGFKIFDRSRSPLVLTAKGAIYLEYLRKIRELVDEMHGRLCEVEEEPTQEFTVSSLSFFSIAIYPKTVPVFMKRYKDVKLVLKDYHKDNYERSVLHGDLDLFLTNCRPKSPDLSYRILKKDEVLIVANRTPKLEVLYDLRENCSANPTEVDLTDLDGQPFYVMEAGMEVRMAAERVCASQKYRPDEVVVIPNMVAATSLVNGGRGVTFISRSSLQYLQFNPNIVFFKVKGYDEILSITAIYRKSPHNVWVDRFCDIVEEVLD